MALDINYLYMFSLSLIRKNQSSGLSATDFNFHWNAAQSSYQSDLLGRFQRMNNGKSGNNTGLIENETILTKLSPFTKPATIAVAGGIANKPSDFAYRLALRCNDKEVYMINHGQIQSVVNSIIDPPSVSEDAYYGVQYEGYWKIFPITVTSVDLDYIAIARQVSWAYTISAGRQVYDPGSSVDPLWDSLSCQEITERMLKTLGVAFSSQDFAAFGQSVVNSGE